MKFRSVSAASIPHHPFPNERPCLPELIFLMELRRVVTPPLKVRLYSRIDCPPASVLTLAGRLADCQSCLKHLVNPIMLSSPLPPPVWPSLSWASASLWVWRAPPSVWPRLPSSSSLPAAPSYPVPGRRCPGAAG